jgi:hypothetical protein
MVLVEGDAQAVRQGELHDIERQTRMRKARLRDGPSAWGLYQDLEDGTRFVETFLVGSWAEHLRQHERTTIADRDVEALARSYHAGPEPPVVTHLLAPSLRGPASE